MPSSFAASRPAPISSGGCGSKCRATMTPPRGLTRAYGTAVLKLPGATIRPGVFMIWRPTTATGWGALSTRRWLTNGRCTPSASTAMSACRTASAAGGRALAAISICSEPSKPGLSCSISRRCRSTLYAVGQYCDERVPDGFGGWGPRFSCNLYLQRAEQAWSVLQHFASMFRAVLIWSTGVVSVAQDRPSDALALFTRANVIDGLFQYEGASLKSRHTVALVAWNDPADAYRQKIEYVADEAAIRQYGVVQTELVAFGCTSRGQAHRAGLWLLYAEQHETETVTFRTGLEGFSLYPGAVFKTTDPNRAGRRMGGRIRAATATEVTLDDAVELDAGQAYTLNLILPDGRIHSAALAMPPGPSAVLTLAEPLPQVPLPDAIWTLSADDLIPESWRLVAAVEVEKGLVEVTGLAYRPDKYDAVEKGLTLMPLPTSTLHRAPDPVTDLHVTESLYRMAGSTFGVRATVSWHGQAARYRVKWRKTQGAWEARESVSASVDIDHLEEAEYAFSVTAFNVLGRASLPVTVIRTLLGRRRPPQAVTGFAYVIEPYGVKLTWDKSPEIDVALYEVREGGAQWE